ncbi:MAG: hypothetical protein D3906_06115 [Candidatus Electrothrix sp. AUS1_2]|nr:hypothetical protein [Candidatus Electrothrix sp. AUS1_2]
MFAIVLSFSNGTSYHIFIQMTYSYNFQERDNNPLKYLFFIWILYIAFLVFPQHIGLNIIIAIYCMLTFIVRPLWGVFFIIAVHPIMMCSFNVFLPVGLPIKIITSTEIPYGPSGIGACGSPFSVYPFQTASFMLLPALIFHSRTFYRQDTTKHYKKTFYITLSFFFTCGIITSLLALYPYKALLGLSRFASLTITIAYIVSFINDIYKLKKVMLTYCCAAIILSFFAYYGTYNGYEKVSIIWNNCGIIVRQMQGLTNGSSAFIAERQGMMPGFGLSGKHEFSTFLVTGFFCSIYLFITTKNKIHSIFYIVANITILQALFYGPSKLSLLGIVIGTLVVTIFNPSIRRYLALIVIVLVGLNILALMLSSYTRPPHTKRTASLSSNFKMVNDSSEFSTSFKGRIAKMKRAAKHIKLSYGLGIGSDMLQHDPIFTDVHGHNLFITLFAEYGLSSIICLFILGKLVGCRVAPIITSQTCMYNRISFVVVPVTASFFAILFEYNFDCFVWAPQLWITGALLWVSGHISNNYFSLQHAS